MICEDAAGVAAKDMRTPRGNADKAAEMAALFSKSRREGFIDIPIHVDNGKAQASRDSDIMGTSLEITYGIIPGRDVF